MSITLIGNFLDIFYGEIISMCTELLILEENEFGDRIVIILLEFFRIFGLIAALLMDGRLGL